AARAAAAREAAARVAAARAAAARAAAARARPLLREESRKRGPSAWCEGADPSRIPSERQRESSSRRLWQDGAVLALLLAAGCGAAAWSEAGPQLRVARLRCGQTPVAI